MEVEVTIMGLRERLMTYFKGGCIDEVVFVPDLTMRPVPRSGAYQYERQEIQAQNSQFIYLADIPILEVHHFPDTVRFFEAPLKRSPEMRQLYESVEKFFNEFLPAVEKVKQDGNI